MRRLFYCCVLVLFANPSFAQVSKPRPVTGPTPTPAPVMPSPILPSPAMPADKVGTQSSWSFLSLQATRIETFLKEHPTYDGRGVIVMIFDTGVDPGVPGLLTTTEDHRKIIDVRDFSGTGDVPYEEAERSGDELRLGNRAVLKGLNSMSLKAWDGHYYYGALNEKRFQNGLGDLNFNGKNDDVFGVLIFQDQPTHWVAYVDSDGDRDLSDEHPVTNYHERYDTFAFHSNDTTGTGARHLNGAVNIYPDRKLASVYFDDGSHGTHVAGIASGHDIDNEKGFNGVAPGAEVVAIKFADNNAGGVTVSGSMQKAFEYAAALADTQPKPVVVNMSFGIGNELEGQSVMDKWLDSLLTATPNLSVCISAGNEGPGLSSIGLPGSAERVITSGAALPDDAARDLYNIYITHPVLFDFSSRGGELAKPDIVSPGTAVSTVPDYVGGDRYNGTSMSSPYTTGCVALLLSAMGQQFPDWKTNAYEIKRALMLSATPLDNLTPLDQGFGMIDIPNAYDLLVRWHRKGYTPVPVKISAVVPSAIQNGTAAYFRAGNYPRDAEREMFTVRPEGQPGLTPHQKAVGMEAFDLVSDSPWMSPVESSIYRRGEGAMHVAVRYNEKLLQKPGLYSGRIWGFEKGRGIAGEGRGHSESQFELVNSIAVPYTFSDQNNYHVALQGIDIAPSVVEREFFAIPPSTKSVTMTLSAPNSKGSVSVPIFDNDGKELSGFGIRRNAAQRTNTLYLSGDQIKPGIWEVDLSRTMSSEDEGAMTLDLTVDAQPLDVSEVNAGIDRNANPKVDITISNPSDRTFSAHPEAILSGYERTIDTLIASGDVFELPFINRPGERGVVYKVSMPPEDYNLFTDVTCMVVRPDSSAVFNSAFDYREKTVVVNFGASKDALPQTESDTSEADSSDDPSYTLLIRGGLALPDHPHPWHVRIQEYRYLNENITLDSDPSALDLSPYESQELSMHSGKIAPVAPAGYRLFGNVLLDQTTDNEIRIPITF
jgi:tripeptidyl-peptidase II